MSNTLIRKLKQTIARITLLLCMEGSASVLAAPVLVDTEWLASRLGAPGLVLVDMAADATQYQRFHLPGAVYLPYEALVRQRKDGVVLRAPDERLFRVLGALGISAESHVVVYDDIGGLQAGRLFWELERVGHARMSVLNGGLVRWILEGRKVESRPQRPQAVPYVPSGQGARRNEASLQEVKLARDQDAALLLDVRTREEYQGDPRGKVPGGHIPGARWWPWDQSVDFGAGFRFKSRQALQQSLAAVGAGDRQQPIVTYCRTGHRAAQSYLILRSLGYENVRLYDGSMVEYERDRPAPLARGSKPGVCC